MHKAKRNKQDVPRDVFEHFSCLYVKDIAYYGNEITLILSNGGVAIFVSGDILRIVADHCLQKMYLISRLQLIQEKDILAENHTSKTLIQVKDRSDSGMVMETVQWKWIS